jgi:DNA-binding response OmpR family regulator
VLSVLVIEHDPAVAELARRYLAREGFTVRLAGTPGEAAAAFAESVAGAYSPDAVVLDLTMPGLNAREIRRALSEPEGCGAAPAAGRSAGSPKKGQRRAGGEQGARPVPARPLVCLAGPGGLRAREVGVPDGACLRRPFGPRSLIARVRAALAAATHARSGDASGDASGGRAGHGAGAGHGSVAVTGQRRAGAEAGGGAEAIGGAEAAGGGSHGPEVVGDLVMQRFPDVALTATERDLLAFLLANPGRVFTRERLLAAVWGTPDGRLAGPGTGWHPGGSRARPAGGYGDSYGGGYGGGQRSRHRGTPAGPRAVDVYVAQLRAKLGDRSPIRTVRGVGYSAQP